MKTKTFILALFLALCSNAAIQAQYTKLYDYRMDMTGIAPWGSLVSDGTWLYGATRYGGQYSNGIVFKIKPDGSNCTTLANFDGPVHGNGPVGSLVLIGDTLYGTTTDGGPQNMGAIFKVSTNGGGFDTLRTFIAAIHGDHPFCSLTLSGDTLFGMTNQGGKNGFGAIFRIKTNGGGFDTLRAFDLVAHGAMPWGGSLALSGNILYGTTSTGGISSNGVIFKINTNGSNFTKLADFDGAAHGASPACMLTLSGSTLYGTATGGGANGKGTVFKINTNGSNFTKLADFDGSYYGSYPYTSLALSGGTLFGMTMQGGINGAGAIFEINTNGTNFTKLADFDVSNGGEPGFCSLTLLGSVLYGLTREGGVVGGGVIFKINTDGSAFSKLVDCGAATNGAYPCGSLTPSGNILYGMTDNGGTTGSGIIFKINKNGTGFTKLIDFDNNHGADPLGTLTLSDDTLYGMTQLGGQVYGAGAIFKMNINGTGFDTLRTFDGAAHGASPAGSLVLSEKTLFGLTYSGSKNNLGAIFKINTNGNGFDTLRSFDGPKFGGQPYGSLVLSGNTLYGMTNNGGNNNLGTIFKINTDGSGFDTLRCFDDIAHGAYPYGSLVLSGSTLYGMTYYGGNNDMGTIFKINTNGSGFIKLADFDGTNHGSNPNGSLIIVGKILYGMTTSGGINNKGVTFKINTDGSGFTKLFDFNGENGHYPIADLSFVCNELYGFTEEGGPDDVGVIFSYALAPIQAKGITTNQIKNRSCSLSWTKGNGFKRIVFAKQAGSGTASPVGGTAYSANSAFGVGSSLGAGWYCVYNGTDTAVTITGLRPTKDYTIKVCEYMGDTVNLNYYTRDTTGNSFTFATLKDSQQITFNSLPAKTYGDADIVPGASSSEGLAITYTSLLDTVATIVSGKIHIVAAGTDTIYANQAGNDTVYAAAQTKGLLTIAKATPVITWANPADITYGTLLSATQLSATSNVAGTFNYTPAIDAKLNAGNAQNLKVDFTPTNTGSYNNVNKTVTITVTKATPIITWANPADITYGTLLSAKQLNATADVEGTLVYTPALGTKLEVANDHTLKADFTPTDAADYNTASKSVTLNVLAVTNVYSLNEADIKLYPNPAIDKLTIECAENISQVTFTGIDGKIVREEKLANTTKTSISLNGLNPGLYFATIQTSSQTLIVKKLVVRAR